MNKKVIPLLFFVIIASIKLYSDKNSFTTIGDVKPFWQTKSGFVNPPNNCNTIFNTNHTESFQPNKTFLTYYSDSLGDLINEFDNRYFSWDKYLTLMFQAVERNVQNLAHRGVNHL